MSATDQDNTTLPPAEPAEPAGQRNFSTTFLLVGLLVLGLLMMIFLFKPPSLTASAAIGKPVPAIPVIPLLGDAMPLNDANDSEPVVTLLHFWGTWCGPCRQEYPELVAMVDTLEPAAGDSFRFVSVSCEPPVGSNTFESLQASTKEYYDSIGVDVPTYCDPGGRARTVAAELLERPAMFYPTTFLIGPKQTVTHVWEGYTRRGVEEMRSAIQAATTNGQVATIVSQ